MERKPRGPSADQATRGNGPMRTRHALASGSAPISSIGLCAMKLLDRTSSASAELSCDNLLWHTRSLAVVGQILIAVRRRLQKTRAPAETGPPESPCRSAPGHRCRRESRCSPPHQDAHLRRQLDHAMPSSPTGTMQHHLGCRRRAPSAAQVSGRSHSATTAGSRCGSLETRRSADELHRIGFRDRRCFALRVRGWTTRHHPFQFVVIQAQYTRRHVRSVRRALAHRRPQLRRKCRAALVAAPQSSNRCRTCAKSRACLLSRSPFSPLIAPIPSIGWAPHYQPRLTQSCTLTGRTRSTQ